MLLPFPAQSLIGMIHVGALPGTPRARLSLGELERLAIEDAVTLAKAGFTALLVENMHDVPYPRRHSGPEIVAAMTRLTAAVVRETALPTGVQILAGANREAIAVAQASGAAFIRAEGFVFAHVADEGIIQSDAAELLRYRRAIGAQSVLVFTDIKKKHSSHSITADVSLAETAAAAEFFAADGVIVTGAATGKTADLAELESVRPATRLPILVGSGITAENLPAYWNHADGFIVGTSIKRDGDWQNAVDPQRARGIVGIARLLQSHTPHPPERL